MHAKCYKIIFQHAEKKTKPSATTTHPATGAKKIVLEKYCCLVVEKICPLEKYAADFCVQLLRCFIALFLDAFYILYCKIFYCCTKTLRMYATLTWFHEMFIIAYCTNIAHLFAYIMLELALLISYFTPHCSINGFFERLLMLKQSS